MIRIMEDLSGDWRRLDERIQHVTEEIEVLAQGSESCRQLMTVPDIGPLIASAMVAAIGNGAAFTEGRDFAAWLGLVPKQISTGDRTILGKLSRRGNRYLRVRAGGVGRADQADGLEAPRAEALDRDGQETAASQRAGDRPRQQARPHRLVRPGPWPGLRGAEDESGSEPIRLIPIPRQRQQRPKK